MKILNQITLCLLTAICIVSLNTACSDNNDDGGDDIGGGSVTDYSVDPSKVFTGGIPKSVSGCAITTNDKGFITKIVDTSDDVEVVFDYAPTTKAYLKYQTVKMSITYKDYPEDNTDILMTIKNGFAATCKQTYADSNDTDTWEFNYTSDGYLIGMVRSEGGNEVTTITYNSEKDITKVSMKSDEAGEGFEGEITYTSDKITTAIENKGCIMLYDETFGIDLDEMKYAYLAGMLGRATKHLPVKMVETEDSKKYTTSFEWTLSKDNYPEKMEMIVEGDADRDEYLFTW